MAEVADEFEDDMDEVRDLEDIDDDVDGEDLFGDTMMRYRLSRVLTTGITESAPKRTFMIRRIWTTTSTTTLIRKLADKSRHNLIDEIGNLLDARVSNDPLRFLIPVRSLRGDD
jgi:hypothetical protein